MPRVKNGADENEEDVSLNDNQLLDEDTGGNSEEHTNTEAEVQVLEIGGAPVPGEDEFEEEVAQAPAWVKELRKKSKENARELRELRQKLAEKEAAPAGNQQPQVKKLREKPTLSGHDFDREAYEQDLDNWYSEKNQLEKENKDREAEQQRQQNEWAAIVDGHKAKKAALKFEDVEDAEARVLSQLDVVQKGIIYQGSNNSALVLYGLDKDPQELKKLLAITDPVKFSVAVGIFEGKLKMTTRKQSTPTPEKTLPGSGGVAKDAGHDKTLERLEAEADKTGDRSKVVAYKRQLRQKGK